LVETGEGKSWKQEQKRKKRVTLRERRNSKTKKKHKTKKKKNGISMESSFSKEIDWIWKFQGGMTVIIIPSRSQ
jgi:hypothetical protein